MRYTAYVGNRTRHSRLSKRSPEPDFNRHPQKYRPLLIGLGKLVATTFKIKQLKAVF
jgi:hypothetical protein